MTQFSREFGEYHVSVSVNSRIVAHGNINASSADKALELFFLDRNLKLRVRTTAFCKVTPIKGIVMPIFTYTLIGNWEPEL